ncbi:hypothetical protein, partial [Blastococcus litoris]|uniref:hypothetical protein n=1 Tax=Blastococcus litoris TaxID=2171622 RepID=UPI0019D1AEF6
RTTYQFVTKTTHLRQHLPEDHTLFLTYIDSDNKPTSSVRPSTVANWVKTVMGNAGVDIQDFKAVA